MGQGQGGAKQAPESRAWGWRPPAYAPRGVGAPRRQYRAHNSLLSGVPGLAQAGGVREVPSMLGQAPEHFPSLGAQSSWGIGFRAMLVAEFTVA